MYKEMKDEESQVRESVGSNSSISSNVSNNNINSNNNGGNNGKRRYKVWAIAGILLLAFWSVFTGSVTLKSWSSVNSVGDDDINSTLSDDLDILELEEREKLVRQLWNTYTHSNTIRLPKFWLDAFKAAYEDLINDASGVRNGAISEIAKLSVKSIDLESSPDPDAITDSPHDQPKSNIKMP